MNYSHISELYAILTVLLISCTIPYFYHIHNKLNQRNIILNLKSIILNKNINNNIRKEKAKALSEIGNIVYSNGDMDALESVINTSSEIIGSGEGEIIDIIFKNFHYIGVNALYDHNIHAYHMVINELTSNEEIFSNVANLPWSTDILYDLALDALSDGYESGIKVTFNEINELLTKAKDNNRVISKIHLESIIGKLITYTEKNNLIWHKEQLVKFL